MHFLIIQTASIGDVILATPIIEKLHRFFPGSKIDFLLKSGNEQLFAGHPFLNRVITWNTQEAKYSAFIQILKDVRNERYDRIINVQRFCSTGLLTCLSKASYTVGFDKNPFSLLFTLRVRHQIGNNENPPHETERNLSLITAFTDASVIKPYLYPSPGDSLEVENYKQQPYLCIAPASLWFTKQYPADGWADFLAKTDGKYNVHLLGSASDSALCDYIISKSGNSKAANLAGKLTLLQTAALMADSTMNFVNDSAPMHLASAMNAPVTVVYCSTVLSYGFGPLSDNSNIVETESPLSCKPCGLHGFRSCPEKHFRCATTIKTEQLLIKIQDGKV